MSDGSARVSVAIASTVPLAAVTTIGRVPVMAPAAISVPPLSVTVFVPTDNPACVARTQPLSICRPPVNV